jgi:phosphoglycolate phosphatase-like HAD superfamily hydrolase
MPSLTDFSDVRVSIRPGFQWDAQDVYLFDIDGTLIRSRDRVHSSAFLSAARQILGCEISLEGVPVHGGTDTAILAEACANAGVSAQTLAELEPAILAALSQDVLERRHEMMPVVMPGVPETLDRLKRRGALLGLATGNLEAIAWIKMEQAGLREWFSFGGFSDHYPIRPELIGSAVRRARDLAGPEASICIVGDTPRDIHAARANSLPVISVSTGRFEYDELLVLDPEVCTTTLADLLAASEAAQ